MPHYNTKEPPKKIQAQGPRGRVGRGSYKEEGGILGLILINISKEMRRRFFNKLILFTVTLYPRPTVFLSYPGTDVIVLLRTPFRSRPMAPCH